MCAASRELCGNRYSLPAALDRAISAGETHTEFLEQLLAVEVEATEARRLARRESSGYSS